jgi:hypothetical protein
MKKAKAFKASGWLGKEMAAAKAAMNRWYLMTSAKGDPQSGATAYWGKGAEKARQKYKDLVLYAAALGIKQGKLPEDLSGWTGQAIWSGDTGSVKFRMGNAWDAVTIPIRFLEWSPEAAAAAPIEMKAAA